jgi:nitronate monooxygenase
VFTTADLEVPIVQAPMAGGPSTVALAAAVSEAGGLGFLAAGYKTVEDVGAEIESLRALTDRPFGINLFAGPGQVGDPVAVADYAATLKGEGPLGIPRHDDDGYAAKLELVAELQVAVLSTTFGCPSRADIDRLHQTGTAVWVTVTTPLEARLAAAAGADALALQGVEAGGHRGSFDDAAPGDIGLLALIALARNETSLPLIAAGGLMTAAAIAGVLAAGASAAALGTAFMLCPEAATSLAHRAAIASPARTGLTRAFTGRTARGIVNRFMRDHGPEAPSAYPEIHHLTAPLRAAAREAGDADGFHLWAGQGHALARELPAAELMAELSHELKTALAHLGND